MGTIMYSNSSIVPSKYVLLRNVNTVLDRALPGWHIQNFFQLHCVIFVLVFAGIVVILTFWRVIAGLVQLVVSISYIDNALAASQLDEEANPQFDFYLCASFATLINEFDKA
jgi:energy-converting hydrogenase Eha subunit C